MNNTFAPAESQAVPGPAGQGGTGGPGDITAATEAQKRYEAAKGPMILAVAALLTLSVPFIPHGGNDSVLAYLLYVLLIVRVAYLGLISVHSDVLLKPMIRAGIAALVFFVSIYAVGKMPDFFDVGRAWPFLFLASCALPVLSRLSRVSTFVAVAGLNALLVFLMADSPWPGIIAMTATAAIAQLGFLSKLRGERPLRNEDRTGGMMIAGLVILTMVAAAFWFPSTRSDSDESAANRGGGSGELGDPAGGGGAGNGGGLEGSGAGGGSGGGGAGGGGAGGGAGGGGLGGGTGTGTGGGGGGYLPSPDGSTVFVPLEPGQPIPPGTVLVEESNGGLGSPEGNGIVTCVDGVLTYEEVPKIRRIRSFVTDSYGDGRILECAGGQVVTRTLEPGELVPDDAIEILADDGRWQEVPRPESEPEEDDSEPFALPSLPWLWILAALLLAGIAFLVWRWFQIPWLTKTLRRFDRIGASYNRRLRRGESLPAFAGRLPDTARPLALQIATELDGFLFSGRHDPKQNPTAPPAEVRSTVDGLLRDLKAQARTDRVERTKARARRIRISRKTAES